MRWRCRYIPFFQTSHKLLQHQAHDVMISRTRYGQRFSLSFRQHRHIYVNFYPCSISHYRPFCRRQNLNKGETMRGDLQRFRTRDRSYHRRLKRDPASQVRLGITKLLFYFGCCIVVVSGPSHHRLEEILESFPIPPHGASHRVMSVYKDDACQQAVQCRQREPYYQQFI